MSTPELPAAPVTVADLYRELVTIRTDVVSLLTKQEVANVRYENDHQDVMDHEKRLRVLEGRTLRWAGAMALLAVLAGALAGWIAALNVHVRLGGPGNEPRPA